MSRSCDRTMAVTGLAVLAATAVIARRREIHPTEHQVFRVLNDVPQPAVLPLAVTMQAGSLAAVYVVAAGALIGRKRRLAVTVAVTGTAVWGKCKLVKQFVGRGRPSAHVENVTVHGSPQSGLGFPSGHSAVAFTLAALVTPYLPRAARPVAWGVAATTAVARMGVGAHLPLDVIGGAAGGLAAAAAARLIAGEA